MVIANILLSFVIQESVKPQQQLPPQPYSSAAALNQANRDQVASSINQIGRRPSAQQPTDQPVATQRPDSRIGSAQQAPLPQQQQPISVQRPIQQHQQQNAQPQFQPRQILQQVLPFPIHFSLQCIKTKNEGFGFG